MSDLGLDRVAIIYPGSKRYPVSEGVEAVPLATLSTPRAVFSQ
jgi:hypothetical protein